MSNQAETANLDRVLNEILILAILRSAPMHGYQIALEIESRSGGFFGFKHGTLYPILHRLEKEGMIDGDWDEGRSRRRKKSYTLTAAGRRHLGERIDVWRELNERLSALVVADPPVRAGAAANQ
jgi:PadR family transcriptional regulator, regulatory protein PadR